MKRLCFLALISSTMLHCSDPFAVGVGAMAHAVSQMDSDDIPVVSSDDDLCETAIETFYSPQLRSKSARLKPFIKKLLHEPTEESQGARLELRKIKSESHDELARNVSPISQTDLKVQRLLLAAAHEALDQQEEALNQKALELEKERKRIEKKMSKTWSGLMTAGVSVLTSGISALSVYYSTKCS